MDGMFVLLLNTTNSLGPYDYNMVLENCIFCLKHADYLRHDIENIVLRKLRISTRVYERDSRFDLLFGAYEKTLQYFPECQKMVLELANHLTKLGYYDEAKNHYEYSLKINERDLVTHKCLLSLRCLLVERWHFVMLNDRRRNEVFKEALELVFKKFEGSINMLDIGTGTSLFALIGAKLNAKKIVACEKSKTMFRIAEKVLQENLNNEQLESVTLLNIESSLMPNEYEKKFNLIITELFDAAVFGERILEVIINAYRFLTPKNKLIIPNNVKGFLVGISCDYFARQIRLTTGAKEILKFLENFHLKTKLKHNYDCYDCKKIEFFNMTNTLEAFSVNFNNYNDLIQFRNYEKRLKFNAINTGTIDAFMLYFKLNLVAYSDLNLSTEPTKESSWDQAIFFNPNSSIKQPNDTIEVDVLYQNERLSIRNVHIDNIPVSYELSSHTMLMLNDLKFVNAILSFNFTEKSLKIFDAMSFPLIGIVMVLKQKCYLTCYRNNKYDNEKLLRAICVHYDIEFDNHVHLIDKSELEDFCKINLKKFDYVFVNYFHKYGMLKESSFKNGLLFHTLLKNKPEDTMLPKLSDVRIYIEIVHSPWLKQVTEVNDNNALGFKIANFINEYQIDEHFDFKIDTIRYNTITGPIRLKTKLSLFECENYEVVRLCRFGGKVNAILYWFEFKLFDKLINTRAENSYVNNAAIILRKDIDLKSTNIRLNIQQAPGLIKMSVCDS